VARTGICHAMRIVSEPLAFPVVLAQAVTTWAFFERFGRLA
jgi:hypothetical protein